MNERISRMFRSGVAMLIVLCMVAGFVPSAAFAVEVKDGNDDGIINYVSFGASNVNGFGVEGYIDLGGKTIEDILANPDLIQNVNVYGYQRMPEDSYPYLVAAALNEAAGGTVKNTAYDGNAANAPFTKVKVNQLGISSMRMEELSYLLGTFEGDSYTEWRFHDVNGDGKGGDWFDKAYGVDDSFEDLRNAYVKAIEEADVITMDMGMNNFGVYISHQVGNPAYGETLEDINPELATDFAKAKAHVKNLVTQYSSEAALLLDGVDSLINALAYAVVGYCHNFDKVMEKIYELNPDVNVVVVSIQNLMTGMYLEVPGVVELPLGDIFGAVIDIANLHTASGSPYCDKYVYADVRNNGRVTYYVDDLLAYNGDPATLTQNMKDCFTLYDYNHLAVPLYALAYTESCTWLLEMLAQTFGVETVGMMAYAYLDINPTDSEIMNKLKAGALKFRGEFLADAEDDFGKYFEKVNELMSMMGQPILGADETAYGLRAMEDAYEAYVAYEAKIFDVLYDVMTTLMQAGVKDHTISIDSLTASVSALRNNLKTALQDEITGAFAGLSANPENYDYTLSENFYQDLAESAGMDYENMMDVLCMYVRTSVGNSFYGHPSPYGHKQIANAVMTALEEDITGDDVVEEEVKTILYELCKLVEKYGPELVATQPQAISAKIPMDDDFKYVAIGDTSAVSKSYVDGVAAALNEDAAKNGVGPIKMVNLAKNDNTVADELANLSDVAGADLITIGFSNVTFLSKTLQNKVVIDWASYIGEENVHYVDELMAVFESSLSESGLDDSTKAYVSSLVEAYAYSAVEYACELPELVNDIKEVNPNALVVIVGMYNPMKGTVIDLGESMSLEIEEYIDHLVEFVAAHGFAYAAITGNAIYVDARDVETNLINSELTLFDLLRMALGGFADMYPTENGHAYIKDQIMKALTLTYGLLGDADGNGKIQTNDAKLILQHIVKMPVQLDLSVCDVDGNGKIQTNDAKLILQYIVKIIPQFPAEEN